MLLLLFFGWLALNPASEDVSCTVAPTFIDFAKKPMFDTDDAEKKCKKKKQKSEVELLENGLTNGGEGGKAFGEMQMVRRKKVRCDFGPGI